MDDLISRQAAIMAVKTGALSGATLFGRTDEGATAYYETVKAIKALPSAQPQRKKGKWILETFQIRCSQCNKLFSDNLFPSNYCPNCGADMRGQQDG